MNFELQENVPLAPYTSLGLGGEARYFVDVDRRSTLVRALDWARDEGLAVRILAGGSNLVVADEGFDGLVLRMAVRGLDLERDNSGALVVAQAGEPWESVVDATVNEGLGGVECLSGIPGSVGATPIQNVGAYGQEVSDTLVGVEVLDTRTVEVERWEASRCELGYRSSLFKRHPGRYVVLSASYRVERDAQPCLDYAQVREALGYRLGNIVPSLSRVRGAVLSLRASKSMLLDPEDENGRSVGSFFTNPILPLAEVERVRALAMDQGMIEEEDQLPDHPVADDPERKKLSAAWLIERAGVEKGTKQGAVGISSRHTLALVHHGGGTTSELLSLARKVRGEVERVFDVRLESEPTFLGDIGL